MDNTYQNGMTPDLVKKQLLQILSSEKFRNSQVLSVFFQYVVEETLAGRVNEIKEYTIGIRALGRPPDFNPQIDAVVRIHAGRLRRMLNEYYQVEGLNDPVQIEIPRGGYIPIFEFRNGDKKLQKIPVTEPAWIAQHKATLAVFPFHNLSADESKDYFVEGMGEQLCIDMARFQHLSVISYYSSRKFSTPENEDTREIHELLDVDYIITGSVRFVGETVQINIQFMLAETGAILWSHTYIRHFNSYNLFFVQDDIIEHLLNKIADSDGIITKNITHSSLKRRNLLGVYESVYLYYSFRGKYDQDTYDRAHNALEHATTIDPDNALLWALLSKLYLNNFFLKIDASEADLEKGKTYVEKAIWLDQNCQYANKALAWTYLLTGKKEDCRETIERCLDLNPKAPSVTGSMGFLMICLGNYAQGFRLLLKTMHLNPIMPWYCNLGFALYYYSNKNYEDAFYWTQRSGILDVPLMSVLRYAAMSKIKELRIMEISPEEYRQPSPDVIERASQLIRQFIYDENLRDRLLDDLRSAGLMFD